jgi:type II secretory pathway component PulM
MSPVARKLRQWTRAALERTLGEPRRRRLFAGLDALTGQARSRYQKLEARERTLLGIAAGLLAALVAYNLVYLPLQSLRADMKVRIEERQRELTEARRLVDTYLTREAELKTAEKKAVLGGADFSLFSVLESALTHNVGRDKIGSITPGADRKLSGGFIQHTVQLKLEDVSLAQIVDALYGVRTLSVPVAVSNLRITQRAQQTHSYDVDMTCIALAKGG